MIFTFRLLIDRLSVPAALYHSTIVCDSSCDVSLCCNTIHTIKICVVHSYLFDLQNYQKMAPITLGAASRRLLSCPRFSPFLFAATHERQFSSITSSTRESCQKLLPRRPNSSFPSRSLILGIETSCDDTGACVMSLEGEVLGEALSTQLSARYLEWWRNILEIVYSPLLKVWRCNSDLCNDVARKEDWGGGGLGSGEGRSGVSTFDSCCSDQQAGTERTPNCGDRLCKVSAVFT